MITEEATAQHLTKVFSLISYIYIYIYVYNHKANADRRKILSTRVLPNCIEPHLVGIELQFAASKNPAHSTEPNGPMK